MVFQIFFYHFHTLTSTQYITMQTVYMDKLINFPSRLDINSNLSKMLQNIRKICSMNYNQQKNALFSVCVLDHTQDYNKNNGLPLWATIKYEKCQLGYINLLSLKSFNIFVT